MVREENQSSAMLPGAKLVNRIIEVRGLLVMLDRDLAEIYGTETKLLNAAVKRNIERFPADFMFQLTPTETVTLNLQVDSLDAGGGSQLEPLRLKSATSKSGRGGRRYYPYAFTEQGVAMLSSVLRTRHAVQINIAIMRAFVELRRWARSHEDMARRLMALERKSDEQYRQIVKVLESFERRLVRSPGSEEKIGFRRGK